MAAAPSPLSLLTRRSSMALLSDGKSHYSHRVRIVLAEKGVVSEIIAIDANNKPAELADLNPYNTLPVLVDRDLSLYDSWVMMEYLDERFPHPPLMPVQPVARAYTRLWRHRIQNDWSGLVDVMLNEKTDKKTLQNAQKELRESLITVAPVFAEKPFFMNDELTLVDCCIVPILWRLKAMGVDLPKTKQVKPLQEYMVRMFSRQAFRISLSPDEREMAQL
jgi:RNA polymerase-associated protein